MTYTPMFYDLIHSPDDGGWYAQVFNRSGKDFFETEILPSKEKARQAALSKFPKAILLKVIE